LPYSSLERAQEQLRKCNSRGTFGDLLQVDFANFPSAYPAIGTYLPFEVDMIYQAAAHGGVGFDLVNCGDCLITVASLPTPEPATLGLLAVGLLAAGLRKREKK
jgi:hypothetical protein